MNERETISADVLRGSDWITPESSVEITTLGDEVRIIVSMPYGELKRQKVIVDINRQSLHVLQAYLTKATLYREEDR